MKILLTGCAGFIGSNLTDRLLSEGFKVVGIDNFNNYYDPHTKRENLKEVKDNKNFTLFREDILNFDKLKKIFSSEKPQKVIHLAARAGVRPSIRNPKLYSEVNVLGTVNLLKLSADFKVNQFIFGSSSSVYGESKKLPFAEDDPCQNIISPYGASKRSAEFFVESFWQNYNLKSTILRFFTVYGPRGRPDMAPAFFTKALLKNQPINQFGDGSSSRDYTYIDDILNGIVKALDKSLDFEIINLGSDNPIVLSDFIKSIENIVGKKANIKKLSKQQGDVETTWANINKAKRLLDWKPKVQIKLGLEKYVKWLKTEI